MGANWLLGLPDIIRDGGLPVRTWPGWEQRSRSSGGYDSVLGVTIHHTASTTSPDKDCAYMWDNSTIRPVGAILLDRAGRVTVGAAGATNHAGVSEWAGFTGLNRYCIGIEAANDGRGEAWPAVQTDAYVRLVAALVKAYSIPIGMVAGHWEVAVPAGRKIDPWGPSPWGQERWDMNAFRGSVFAYLSAQVPPPRPPDQWDGLLYEVTAELRPVSWWEVWRRTHVSPPTAERVETLIKANGDDPILTVGRLLHIPGRIP